MSNQKVVLYFLLFVFVVCAALYGPTSVSQAQTIPPTDLPTITYDTPTSYLKLCPNCVFLSALQGKESVIPSPPSGGGSVLILSSSYNDHDPANPEIWVEVQNPTSSNMCSADVVAKVLVATGESYNVKGDLLSTLAPWEKGVVHISLRNLPTTGYELSVQPGSWAWGCDANKPAILQVEGVTVTQQIDSLSGLHTNLVQVAATNPYTYMLTAVGFTATLYDDQGKILGWFDGIPQSWPGIPNDPPPYTLPGQTVKLRGVYMPKEYPTLPASIHLKPYGSRIH